MVLDEKLVAVKLHARRVVNRLAGLNAEHDVLRVGVVFAEVVAVVGGDQRQAKIFFQLEEAGMDAVLHLEALVLNLEVEVLFAENISVGGCGSSGGVVFAFGEALGDFALKAAGEANQSTGVFGEKLLADARLVIKTVERGFRRDFDQVAVAFFVLGEHQQVVVAVAFGRGAVVVFLADVEFATNDGLDSGMLRSVDEVDCAKDVAVVGHGHGGHAQLFYAVAEFFDVTGAVEQGVVRMQVQVDELGHGSVTSLAQAEYKQTVEGCGGLWVSGLCG